MPGDAASLKTVADSAHHADELTERLLGTDLCTEHMHDMKLNKRK